MNSLNPGYITVIFLGRVMNVAPSHMHKGHNSNLHHTEICSPPLTALFPQLPCHAHTAHSVSPPKADVVL